MQERLTAACSFLINTPGSLTKGRKQESINRFTYTSPGKRFAAEALAALRPESASALPSLRASPPGWSRGPWGGLGDYRPGSIPFYSPPLNSPPICIEWFLNTEQAQRLNRGTVFLLEAGARC